MKAQHEVAGLLKLFDPSHMGSQPAALMLTRTGDLDKINPIKAHISIDQLKQEMPYYQAAAANFTVDHSDISEFTCKVLKFWAGKGYMFPEWARAANIVFSLSPNSAACERVFSLLQYMFGDTQDGALADYIQTALMLKYNNRAVG